jgi:hypothetical protein
LEDQRDHDGQVQTRNRQHVRGPCCPKAVLDLGRHVRPFADNHGEHEARRRLGQTVVDGACHGLAQVKRPPPHVKDRADRSARSV